MIRKEWVTRAALLTLIAAAGAGCASSASRMPPTGPVGMAAPVAAPPYDLTVAPPMTPAPYSVPGAVTPPYAPPVAAPYAQPLPEAPAPVSGIAGLTERQPDLCKASEQARTVGQPGSVIPTLGLTRTYRIVEFRGIEPQDYDPNRLVFRLDSAGIITKVDCG